MNDDNNEKSMNPQVFEQFLREIHNRLGEFELDKAQTTQFFNEAIKQINENYAVGGQVEYFQVPQPDLDEE